MAVYQSKMLRLTHRHREQAPSHMDYLQSAGQTYLAVNAE